MAGRISTYPKSDQKQKWNYTIDMWSRIFWVISYFEYYCPTQTPNYCPTQSSNFVLSPPQTFRKIKSKMLHHPFSREKKGEGWLPSCFAFPLWLCKCTISSQSPHSISSQLIIRYHLSLPFPFGYVSVQSPQSIIGYHLSLPFPFGRLAM